MSLTVTEQFAAHLAAQDFVRANPLAFGDGIISEIASNVFKGAESRAPDRIEAVFVKRGFRRSAVKDTIAAIVEVVKDFTAMASAAKASPRSDSRSPVRDPRLSWF